MRYSLLMPHLMFLCKYIIRSSFGIIITIGIQSYGSSIKVFISFLPFPICLVLGSEGKGIRHGIKKHLELKVSLPIRGAALSFNVSMACAIFCHEISKEMAKNIKK